MLPGMPLQFDDPDTPDETPRSRRQRLGGYEEPKRPWWRPASKFGRIALATAALIVLGGLATAGILLKRSLERDARFRIEGTGNIQSTGLTEVSRAEMLPVFGEDIGRNVFFVPLGERRRQLEQIPWIERATVMRLLPDQIRVSIVERQPVAFTRQGNEIGLVDANGVLLTMPPAAMARHHYSFPVLTGIDPGDKPESRKTRMAVYQRLMAELDAGGQRYSEQISEIDLTDPEDARITMPEQGTDILAHFGEDHFLERYQRYKAHIAEWRQQYPHLTGVDLRYDQQVVLQMASGKQAADAGAAAGAPQTGDAAAGVTQAADNATAKPAPSKAAATKAAPMKPGAKSVAKKPEKASTKALAKNAAAKKKAAEQKKHEQKLAALHAGNHKPTGVAPPAAHHSQPPVAPAEQGG